MNENHNRPTNLSSSPSESSENAHRRSQSDQKDKDSREEIYSGKYQSSPEETPSLLAWLFGKL